MHGDLCFSVKSEPRRQNDKNQRRFLLSQLTVDGILPGQIFFFYIGARISAEKFNKRLRERKKTAWTNEQMNEWTNEMTKRDKEKRNIGCILNVYVNAIYMRRFSPMMFLSFSW